jgi:hypothetical protein
LQRHSPRQKCISGVFCTLSVASTPQTPCLFIRTAKDFITRHAEHLGIELFSKPSRVFSNHFTFLRHHPLFWMPSVRHVRHTHQAADGADFHFELRATFQPIKRDALTTGEKNTTTEICDAVFTVAECLRWGLRWRSRWMQSGRTNLPVEDFTIALPCCTSLKEGNSIS